MVRNTATTAKVSTTTYLNTTAKKKSTVDGELTRLLSAVIIPETLASTDAMKATARVPKLKTITRPPRSTRSNRHGSDVWETPLEDEDRDSGLNGALDLKRKEQPKEAAREANEPPKKKRNMRRTTGKAQLAEPVNAEIDTRLGLESPRRMRASRRSELHQRNEKLNSDHRKGNTNGEVGQSRRQAGRSALTVDPESSPETAPPQDLETPVQRRQDRRKPRSSREDSPADDDADWEASPDDGLELQYRTHKVDDRSRSIAIYPSADDVDQALEGFERPASFFGGRIVWAKMLLAANFNKEPTGDLYTKAVMAYVCICIGLKARYKALPAHGAASSAQYEVKTVELIKLLERKTLKLLQKISSSKEDLVYDTYHGAIPALVYLLQSVANARFAHGAFGPNALEELLNIADLLARLCVKVGQVAKGADYLQAGVRGDTRAAIKTGLHQLMEDWQARSNLLEAGKKS